MLTSRAPLDAPGTADRFSPPCRFTTRSLLVLLLLTAAYMAVYLFQPPVLRLSLVAVSTSVVALLWMPRPSSWLPAIPLIILLGGSNVAVGNFYPAYATLALLGFFAFYFLDRIIWNGNLPRLTPAMKLILAAVLLQTASIVVSIHVHGQHALNALREGSGPFLFFPLAFIVTDVCRDRKRLLTLSRACVVGLLVAGGLGVLEYFSISGFSRIDLSLGYVYKGRVASLLGNANVLAGYLEITTPFVLALALWEKSRKWRILALTATLAGVLSVLYTFSRGGLLALSLGCSLVLVVWFRKQLWLPVLIIGGFLFLMVNNADTFERQMSFFLEPQAQLSQPTLLHRYVTYSEFWHQFSQSPITGVGWGAREFYWGRTQIYTFWAVRHMASTAPIKLFGGMNNVMLSFAVKGGVVSLSALFLLVLASIRAIPRRLGNYSPWGVGITAGLLGFGMHQLMDNFLQWPQTSAFFWLYLGILIASGMRETA